MMSSIVVSTLVLKPVELVWQTYNEPKHMEKWNFASDDWFCPSALSDFKVGGSFKSNMAAKDGSFAFDFEGIYDVIKPNQQVSYHMADGRKVDVLFTPNGLHTHVFVTFDIETYNEPELQRQGWQAILDNFKRYTESL